MLNYMDYMRMNTPNPMVLQQLNVQRAQEAAQPQGQLIQDATSDPNALDNMMGIMQSMSGNSRPRATLPIQAVADNSATSGFEPTTGAAMEATSRNSLDDLTSKLAALHDQNRQDDRNQQWMSFFGKLASSTNPRLLGSLGESANALSETIGKQGYANKALDQASLEDQIKAEQWKQEEARQQQALAQTGAYQQGELGLKKQALEQGKYTINPDGLGGFLKVNNKTGETETVGSPMGNVPTSGVDDKGNPLTGDDYLKTLDPRIARTAKMVANGDMPWPGGFALKSPYWQNVIAAAQTYDPSANGNRFPAMKQFNTGKQGDQVRAFDVGIAHLNTLSTLSDALDNKDTRLLNTAANSWKTQTGSDAPTNFNAAKDVVGNEIVKAIVGAGGGVSDRDKAQQAVNAASSPAQLKGVIDTYKTLMKGQLGGLKQQYENSTGRKDFYDRLTPTSRDELKPVDAANASSGLPKIGDIVSGHKYLGGNPNDQKSWEAQ